MALHQKTSLFPNGHHLSCISMNQHTVTYTHTSAISVNTMKYTRTAKFPVAAAKPSIRTCQLLPNNSSNRITGTQEIDTQMNRGYAHCICVSGWVSCHACGLWTFVCVHVCHCVQMSLILELVLTKASENIVKIVEPIVQASSFSVELLDRERFICAESVTNTLRWAIKIHTSAIHTPTCTGTLAQTHTNRHTWHQLFPVFIHTYIHTYIRTYITYIHTDSISLTYGSNLRALCCKRSPCQ